MITRDNSPNIAIQLVEWKAYEATSYGKKVNLEL